MRRVKKLLAVILSLGMVVALTTVIPAGATTETTGKKDVVDSEFVFCTLDWSGEIEEIQVFEILSLNGDGTFDVREKKAFDEDTGWQGVKSFTKPKVEGDYLVWEGLKSEDHANYIAAAKFSEAMVEEAKTRIPLDVRFKYRFDGVPVEDLNEITGKSGRFEMEVTFRNTSKEKTRVEYKDPDTGEMKETEVETYLPLVIQPYDWYFDNRIFYNLEADPTGLVVPMPDFYNVGWSIPLFPPATEESHTIWVKADVKNFQMPPLTLAVAFVFPETNQVNPTALFKAGLEELYGGVKQINEGVGDPAKEDTLLYGITAVDEGLRMMADAQEGLPYAKANIDTAMIPGVRQAAAGIGSEDTPDTLLYADAQVTAGLQQMLAGIGSATTAETLLYAMAQMDEGLQEIAAGIGDPSTSPTLRYAMAQMQAGLESIKAGIGSASSPNTLLWAVAQVQAGLSQILLGANQMIGAIGDPTTPGTLLNGLSQILAGIQDMSNGLGSVGQPGTIIDGLNTMATNLSGSLIPGVQGIQGLLSPGGTGVYDYVDTISVTDPNWPTTYEPTILGMLSAYASNLGSIASGLQAIYDGLAAALPNGIIANLQYIKDMMDTQIIPGLQQIMLGLDNPGGLGLKQGLQQIAAGVGSSTTPNTLLYAMAAIQAGLEDIAAGIGDPTVSPSLLYAAVAVQGGLLQILQGIGDHAVPDTLLYAVAAVEAGLNQMKAGIGDAATDETLLYAMAAMQMGLHQIKAGMSTGDPDNPGLLEGLQMLSAGLADAIVGIGSSDAPDTLLYGTNAIKEGLTQVGGGTQQMVDGLYKNLVMLNTSEAELEAIAERGEEFDHLLGRSEDADNQVRFVYQMKPTYNYKSGSKASWVTAVVLSVIFAILLVGGGILLSRRAAA
ncbi:MAG: hypothetical protein H5T72_08010 [Actinobacteria bacterium]|nr:hypothetical protein [Actinomycetota bacterium]